MRVIESLSRAFGLTLALLASATCQISQAQLAPGYPELVEANDPREIGMLPSYCIYTQIFRDRVPGGNDPPVVQQWYARMGQTFHHMHHYCWGLMKTNRAILLSRDETTRRFYLTDAIREFDYVISHATTDFVLLPEILSKKGENLIRLGRGSVGILELERAIELNADYWPPYAHLSDYYKSSGDANAAREWLEKGLARSPEAMGLTRRLSELGRPARGSKGKP